MIGWLFILCFLYSGPEWSPLLANLGGDADEAVRLENGAGDFGRRGISRRGGGRGGGRSGRGALGGGHDETRMMKMMIILLIKMMMISTER